MGEKFACTKGAIITLIKHFNIEEKTLHIKLSFLCVKRFENYKKSNYFSLSLFYHFWGFADFSIKKYEDQNVQDWFNLSN